MSMYMNPVGIAAFLVMAVNTVLVLYQIYAALTGKDVQSVPWYRSVDAILLVTFLLLFVTFLESSYGVMRITQAFAANPAGSARDLVAEMVFLFAPLCINITVASLFLVAWFVLRRLLRRIPAEILPDLLAE